MCVAEMHDLESTFNPILNLEERLLCPWQHLQDPTAVQVVTIQIIKKENQSLVDFSQSSVTL